MNDPAWCTNLSRGLPRHMQRVAHLRDIAYQANNGGQHVQGAGTEQLRVRSAASVLVPPELVGASRDCGGGGRGRGKGGGEGATEGAKEGAEAGGGGT